MPQYISFNSTQPMDGPNPCPSLDIGMFIIFNNRSYNCAGGMQVPELPAGSKFRSASRRRGRQQGRDDAGSRRRRGAEPAPAVSASTDMDRWLEHVFDQALDGTITDDADDERTLSGRIKGGGDNPQQQPTATASHCLDSSSIYTALFHHRLSRK